MQKTKIKSLSELAQLAPATRWPSAENRLAVDRESGSLLDIEPLTAVAKAMFEHIPAAMMMVDDAGIILQLNPASEKLFGHSEADLLGKPVEALLPFGLRDHHKLLRDGFLAAPSVRPMGTGRRLAARHKDGHEISIDIGLSPLVFPGRPTVVLLSITDNSNRERAERAELFVRELSHRAKNMFSVILAISRQISHASADIGSFQPAFEERLGSFAATYRLFAQDDGRGASIADLVRSQLTLFNGCDMPQVSADGPNLRLPVGPTEHLGLAIHELATNAIKYGALSVQGGKVEIRWAADAAAQLFQFDWIERCGPVVTNPTRKGFGSLILKHVVPSAFGGVATLLSTPEGMAWHLEAPLKILSTDVAQELR